MEALPDFENLSDDDLERLIDTLTERETRLSFERRTLQGTLDILCAERTTRRGHGSSTHLQPEELAHVLSRRTPPGWLAHERLAFRLAF